MWEIVVSGCQLTPWGRVKAGAQAVERETSADLAVFIDVLIVVKIDERVPCRLAKDGKHRAGEQEADYPVGPTPRQQRFPRRALLLEVLFESVIRGALGRIDLGKLQRIGFAAGFAEWTERAVASQLP